MRENFIERKIYYVSVNDSTLFSMFNVLLYTYITERKIMSIGKRYYWKFLLFLAIIITFQNNTNLFEWYYPTHLFVSSIAKKGIRGKLLTQIW